MKVAILGSGIVGQTLGGGFLKHGHQVMMGTRDPKKEEVANWVAQTPGATAGNFSGGAKFWENIVLGGFGENVGKGFQKTRAAKFKRKNLINSPNPTPAWPPLNRGRPINHGPH